MFWWKNFARPFIYVLRERANVVVGERELGACWWWRAGVILELWPRNLARELWAACVADPAPFACHTAAALYSWAYFSARLTSVTSSSIG